jgi:hypothetical protein
MLNSTATAHDDSATQSDPTSESLQQPEPVKRSAANKATSANKRSYTVTCPSAFRDAVNSLAAKRGVNAADLARSVVLLLPESAIREFEDPGEPSRDDRETVVLKSGPSAGRPWRRKPRLQVRMADGFEPELIRRALGIALSMADGDASVSLEAPGVTSTVVANTELLMMEEKLCRFRTVISVLRFSPLPTGINSRDDALHILGFAPGRYPGMDLIKARYRELATVFHPDGDHGDHMRMSQVNEAMEVLKRSLI